MNWNTAFDQTIREFGISAKWLAEESGISQQTISKFRKGHSPMTTDNLNLLLAKLPFEARQRFFCLVLGASLPQTYWPPISEQIKMLSVQSRKQLVMDIVDSFPANPV